MTRQPGRVEKRYFLSVLVLLIFSLVSWTAVHSEEALSVAVEKGHPKIESALFDLQQKYLLHGKAVSEAFARERNLRMDAQDRVTVFILPKAGETKDAIDVEALQAFGGEVVKSGDTVIKAKVPVLLLDQIADHVKGVNFIKQPDRPRAQTISEGVSLTGASLYQASGYRGQNVSVAIIDLGFANLSDAIAAGVLPSSVIAIDCEGGECAPTDFPSEVEPHGTAVAEIVHEMAPDAQLYLIKIGDNLDLKNAKDYCIANGIRVINHSVGWYVSNFYDGACYFDNADCAANHAYKNGILWVNAMGNDAMSHYEATFIDSDGDRLHNVTPNNNYISLYVDSNLYPIIALLTWDAWPATAQDYDLLLFDGSLNLVASSTNIQDGTQPPQEVVGYQPLVPGAYYLAVRNSSATENLRFSIFNFNQDLDPHVASSSLVSPADAVGVMAVAAINQANWLNNGPQEYFSSQGPTTDGRMKPEISGPDGTSSFIYPASEGSFLGTSAASPHVAGAAALILSNNPGFTVSQLWNSLTSTAIDIGSPGQDPIYGYGRLNLSTIFVDPASIDFGGVLVGSSADEVITIQNIGGPSLTIGTVTAPVVPFTLVQDSCSGKSLALSGTCTLTVRFSPSSTGDFSGTLTVSSSDLSRGLIPVPLKGKGNLVVNLSVPADQYPTTTCSMDNPPVFEWEVNGVVTGYELQFSPDPAFGSAPVAIKTSGLAYGMTFSQWKKVLSIPGANGGTVYWRVVGTKPDGTPSPSNNRAILIAPPQSVGTPAISPVSRNKLPTLTWQDRCNVKFKVWFGKDPGFSRKTFFLFRVSDPNLNGGAFSLALTSDQWMRIRRLVDDEPGSTIYWYVESWDGLNRYSVTALKSFILTD